MVFSIVHRVVEQCWMYYNLEMWYSLRGKDRNVKRKTVLKAMYKKEKKKKGVSIEPHCIETVFLCIFFLSVVEG